MRMQYISTQFCVYTHGYRLTESVYVMRGTRSDLSPAAINQPDTTNPAVLWSAEYLSPVTRKRVLRWGYRLNTVNMLAQHFVAQIYNVQSLSSLVPKFFRDYTIITIIIIIPDADLFLYCARRFKTNIGVSIAWDMEELWPCLRLTIPPKWSLEYVPTTNGFFVSWFRPNTIVKPWLDCEPMT